LREWLPLIMNEVKPFLSSTDIEKGQRWNSEVAARLDSSDVGIICVTPASLHSDWLLFEAGALAKNLSNALVCPLLVDLKQSDVTGPLSQFQLTLATKDEIGKGDRRKHWTGQKNHLKSICVDERNKISSA